MLIPDELGIIHPKKEYAEFIRSVSSSDNDILEVSRTFDDWLTTNKFQLTDIYQALPEKEPGFLTWARECYFFWLYNQEKKAMRDEIDDITSMS